MTKAPFRLIAVANRTDLSEMPDRAADGGEGRLVFAVTDGAGDDPNVAPLPMTVIFEYAQHGPALDWTKRWHELGFVPAAQFSSALAALSRGFVARGTLAQIRTADALTGRMLLHQFKVDTREGAREIVGDNVRNTPDWNRVTEANVRDYAEEHADEIANGTSVMPKEWWASSSSLGQEPRWLSEVPNHEAVVRETCGGCHAQSETGFQIDPLAKGKERFSRFLSDETKERDEMKRRIEWMQLTLWKATPK